jgi:hypothetical protein
VVHVYWILLVGTSVVSIGDIYSWNFGNWFLYECCIFNVGICMKIILLAVLLLSGCSHYTQMKDVYIDNSSVNNYVGNPCAFYVGDHCIVMKKTTPRNPDYPVK